MVEVQKYRYIFKAGYSDGSECLRQLEVVAKDEDDAWKKISQSRVIKDLYDAGMFIIEERLERRVVRTLHIELCGLVVPTIAEEFEVVR